ncbi:hypothetical protein ACH5RR_029654 [Cinchona calisaya]|uniref:Uncharacterized protein n=1 Tax=Cinchona calisaya TaxID=153742 RepID=A0ABD2YSD9_9GENT
MVTLQLVLQMPSLHSLFSNSLPQHPPSLPSAPSHRLNIPRALASSQKSTIITLLKIAALTTTISLIRSAQKSFAIAEESLSKWERIYLPINPGVVLLDIAFVPDDPTRG